MRESIFGAMAGGIAVGSTAGALLESVIGWRGLFLGVSYPASPSGRSSANSPIAAAEPG